MASTTTFIRGVALGINDAAMVAALGVFCMIVSSTDSVVFGTNVEVYRP